MRTGRFGPPPAENRIQVSPTIAVRKSSSSPPANSWSTPFPCAENFPEKLSTQLRGAEKIFVLGIGMNWKGDDRLGCALARVLAQALAKKLPDEPNIRIVSGGEAPENFTGVIRAYFPSHVILLDAVDHGLAPGTVFLADEQSIAVGDMTSHHLPLKLLMRFLSASIPCRVILVGIQPQTLMPGNKLSTPVKKTLPLLAEFLARHLREWIKK